MLQRDPALDPFGSLEDAADPATRAWTAEQNLRTRRYLDALPDRRGLAARFDGLLRTDGIGVPTVRGGRAFFTARRGDSDQAVLYVRDGAGERALLDPIALDARGLISLDWWYVSPLGTYVAYGLSRNGDERSTLHVLASADGRNRSDEIPDTRYCSVAWTPDERAFYYTRYPPGGVYDVRVYRHELGDPPERDTLVFGEAFAREDMPALSISADGRRLAITVHSGWARSQVHVADTAASRLRFAPVTEGREGLFFAIPGNRSLLIRTDDGAPRFALYEVAYDRLERDRWRCLVPEGDETLESAELTAGGILLTSLARARSVVRLRRPDGALETIAALAERSVLAIDASEDAGDAYVLHASFLEPPSVMRLETASARVESEAWATVPVPFDARAYRVAQEWFVSRDGTRVPLTIVSRAGVPRDGSAPAILYGYGGFNVSLVPSYTPSVVPWLDAGGVYAIANLRGGGEFGEAWHRAGMREKKQNVFDDAIAALEYLGTSGIADPARIAILGGSNGGLLVAAIVTQRPDLLAAAVCLVPLTDMLRFHEFLIARLWIAEYGDPDVAEDAAFLRAYSPYHNVRAGVAYPAMLVASAESDGRVDPMHALKFGALVQRETTGDAPILVSIEAEAGHGAGKPRRKVVAELADRYAFLGAALGVGFVSARA